MESLFFHEGCEAVVEVMVVVVVFVMEGWLARLFEMITKQGMLLLLLRSHRMMHTILLTFDSRRINLGDCFWHHHYFQEAFSNQENVKNVRSPTQLTSFHHQLLDSSCKHASYISLG